MIEQPLEAIDVAGLKGLPEDIRKTIAADESLLSAKDGTPSLLKPPRAAGHLSTSSL
ncbi:MAG: hypothetical protein WDO14_07800 [Bacteroidota bacterium]